MHKFREWGSTKNRIYLRSSYASDFCLFLLFARSVIVEQVHNIKHHQDNSENDLSTQELQALESRQNLVVFQKKKLKEITTNHFVKKRQSCVSLFSVTDVLRS